MRSELRLGRKKQDVKFSRKEPALISVDRGANEVLAGWFQEKSFLATCRRPQVDHPQPLALFAFLSLIHFASY